MTTNVDVDFGIILEINGKDVAIEPSKAITDFKKNGVTYNLNDRVEIGTANDLKAFLDTLAPDVPDLPKANDYPTPLDTVFNKLTKLHLAVEKLELKVPPSLKADNSPITPAQPTTFTLKLSATWADNDKVSLIEGKLAIKGLYVTVAKT